MKYVFGILATALLLFVSSYLLLGLWGVDMLAPQEFRKVLITVGLVLATAFILVVFILVPVFKNNAKGYHDSGSGIAQKK